MRGFSHSAAASPSCVTEKASRVALPDFERPGSAELLVSSHGHAASFPPLIPPMLPWRERRARERKGQSYFRVCDSNRKAVDFVLDSDLLPFQAGSGPNVSALVGFTVLQLLFLPLLSGTFPALAASLQLLL